MEEKGIFIVGAYERMFSGTLLNRRDMAWGLAVKAFNREWNYIQSAALRSE